MIQGWDVAQWHNLPGKHEAELDFCYQEKNKRKKQRMIKNTECFTDAHDKLQMSRVSLALVS